jgi:hypothetical protein
MHIQAIMLNQIIHNILDNDSMNVLRQEKNSEGKISPPTADLYLIAFSCYIDFCRPISPDKKR